MNDGDINRLQNTSDSIRHSFECAEKALGALPEMDREMMMWVYKERDTFEDNVYNASVKYSIPQDRIWQMNDDLIRRFAKLKKLI